MPSPSFFLRSPSAISQPFCSKRTPESFTSSSFAGFVFSITFRHLFSPTCHGFFSRPQTGSKLVHGFLLPRSFEHRRFKLVCVEVPICPFSQSQHLVREELGLDQSMVRVVRFPVSQSYQEDANLRRKSRRLHDAERSGRIYYLHKRKPQDLTLLSSNFSAGNNAEVSHKFCELLPDLSVSSSACVCCDKRIDSRR